MSRSSTAISGRVFEIQRFSIHDGPGIRTTVFLKGCPLRCLWCHNPEGVAPESAISFTPQKCIGCGYCFRTCPRGAHRMEGDRHVLDRRLCVACGACTKECYSKALECVGRDVSVEEVLDEVLRDKPFYETSGGGMTLSGGEPLMQPAFTDALLRSAKDAGLHCAMETCGFAAWACFERVLPYVDLFLYDIKETDDARHREFTGASNRRILRNLERLHDAGAAILVRLPVIPGFNDRDDHFRALAELSKSLPRLLGFEVMPYHPLGTSKLGRLGIETREPAQVETPSQDTVRRWLEALRALGVCVKNGSH